jgi:hypothetical protein
MPLIVFEHDWNNAALAALHPCMCLFWSLNFMYEHGTSALFLLHYTYLSYTCMHVRTNTHTHTYIDEPINMQICTSNVMSTSLCVSISRSIILLNK